MKVKNHLLSILVSLCAPKGRITRKPRSILVVSTTGLGDTLWATPALRALRERWPEATIDVLTSSIGAEALEGNPHIDALHRCDSLIPLYWQLRRRRFDTAYLFHTSQRIMLPFIRLLGIGTVIGYAGGHKGLDHLLSVAMEKEREHEIIRRLRLVGMPTAACQMEIATEPFTWSGTRPVAALHVGAQTPFKEWPLGHFVELGRRLRRDGFDVVLTGSRHDYTRLRCAASKIEGSMIAMWPLRRLASFLKSASLFVTNDTGPMHIGIAAGAPTVALFSPTDPELCGPLQAPHVTVVSERPTCTPCLKQRCRAPFCMEQLTVDTVYEACAKRMKK